MRGALNRGHLKIPMIRYRSTEAFGAPICLEIESSYAAVVQGRGSHERSAVSEPAKRVLSPTGTKYFYCQHCWEMLDLCSSEQYVSLED